MSAHAYSQRHPNERIDLGTFPLPVRVPFYDTDNDARPLKWTVTQTFSPSPRLELSATDAISVDNVFRAIVDTEAKYSLDILGCEPVLLTLDMCSCEGVTLAANVIPCQLFPPTNRLSKASFCVFNWPPFRPQPDTAAGILATFAVNDWLVDVSTLPAIEERIKALGKSGGYIMTHTATVRKTGGEDFSSQELDSLANGLHNFFSFALGKWSGPQFLTATDRDNQLRYFTAGIGKLSDGANTLGSSWVDAHHIEIIKNVAPGFMELISVAPWQDTLGDVIYFYVNANSLGRGVNVDTSALFTQAALELLAWTYCVHDRKLVLEDMFRKSSFSAADQIRLLCRSLGVPLDIPPELTDLQQGILKPNDPRDLASALTRLRQLVTHPGKRDNLKPLAFLQGWEAAQWLIELIILRLSNYRGKYAKRFASRYVGAVEDVPWAAGHD